MSNTESNHTFEVGQRVRVTPGHEQGLALNVGHEGTIMGFYEPLGEGHEFMDAFRAEFPINVQWDDEPYLLTDEEPWDFMTTEEIEPVE